MTKIGILNDYQGAALSSADWSVLPPDCEIEVLREALPSEDAYAERLQPFDILVAMRERTAFPRSLLQRLPKLKLLVTTGARNAAFDMAATRDLGITVAGTRGSGPPTAELTWGLILALARHIPVEDRGVRDGRWQLTVGEDLSGRTLGVVGLGNLGTQVARIGLAFGMNVIAWSTNLTAERAEAVGAKLVTKDELFAQSDFVTIHLQLSDRSRGLVSAGDIAGMQPTAYLVNTSRGPIVDEAALAEALRQRRIAGAGVDVFSQEPLPKDHPYLSLDNIVLTPHLGYVTKGTYRIFYGDAVEDIRAFLAGTPVRVVQP